MLSAAAARAALPRAAPGRRRLQAQQPQPRLSSALVVVNRRSATPGCAPRATRAAAAPLSTALPPPARHSAPNVAIPALAAAPAAPALLAAPVMNAASTAWLMVCTAGVLAMNLPGLCMFYGGMLDSRNVVSMFMTCTAVACTVTLLWFVCGYSLVFSAGGNGFVGGLDRLFMAGVTPLGPLVGEAAALVPEALFAVFHSTYAAITPCVIVGAYAARMRFSASILFCCAWMLTVYVPFARMVWGGGFLHQAGLIDFAGGVVIHVTAGVSALVAAHVIGPRKRFRAGTLPPAHSMVMIMAGSGLIWATWLCFNGGSVPSGVSPEAAWVFLTTMAAAAAGGTAWMLLDTFAKATPGDAHGAGGKPTGLGACCGIIAGLVCITPAALFVNPWSAAVMGAAGAVCCRAACAWLRATAAARGSDDACEVFGLHGTGGILGNALTAIFAATQLGGTRVVANIPAQFALHNAAALAACIWAAACTWGILKALDALLPGGIRVSEAVEEEGLDLGEHGDVGYAIELPAPPAPAPVLAPALAPAAVAAMAAVRDAN